MSLYLGLKPAFENTTKLIALSGRSSVNAIAAEVDGILGPVEQSARNIVRLVDRGVLDLTDPDDLGDQVPALLSGLPQVTGIAFILPDLTGFRFGRDGAMIPDTDLSETPGVRDFIQQAQVASGSYWGAPLHLTEIGRTVVNLRTPVTLEDWFIGVLVHVVTIDDLSLRLALRTDRSTEVPFILYGRDRILAHPLLATGVARDRSEPLPRLDSGFDPILPYIWSQDREPMRMLETAALDYDLSSHVIGDRRYVFFHRTIDRYGPEPWTVGAHIRPVAEAQAVESLRQAVAVGLAVLVVAVVVSIVVGKAVRKPVARLAAAAAVVSKGDLDQVPMLPPARFTEPDDAARAFNEMIAGLREKRLMRELFGKVVPEPVAHELLADKGALEPLSTEATVLFTDLQGFTALCEPLDPPAIVTMLNEYFTEATGIVEAHGGIITQFQGDAILAVFNVPLTDPDHAGKAVDAGIDLVRATEARAFGGQTLVCRVGINTGPLVAGNVGAEGRFNYTVHGDAVNLAARLEALNKKTGTRLLLSDETARRMNRDIPLVDQGTIAVRGKVRPVRVFAPDLSSLAATTAQRG